jgi:citrate lyase subunit beta / citryl-CoA lyase
MLMRSMLLLPATDVDGLASAAAGGAEIVVVDLTSSPQPAQTTAALEAARANGGNGRATLYARIPALSQSGSADMLDRAVAGGVDGIMLAGSNGGPDITLVDARIAVAEAMHDRTDGSVAIVAEAADSGRAVLGLASYRGASNRLAALVWNPAALAADLGGISHYGGNGDWRAPLAHARTQVLFAAASAKVAALEMLVPHSAGAEPQADARAQAEAALADGFSGMVAASGDALAIINAVFAG